MNQSSFSKISQLSESFCEKCFKYDPKDTDIIKILKEMVRIIKSSNKDIKELLLVFVEKGARTAFLKYALPKTQRGEKATEGITSDNEFGLLITELKTNYPDQDDTEIVIDIFSHLSSEVNNLSAEINITALQSFNSVDATYKENEKSVNEKLSSVNQGLDNLKNEYETHLNDFKKDVKDIEKKMHESNITILGIFSAVVLAFNAALTFSTSVLQNLNNSDLYRILMASLIIGLVIINVLCGLFYYLEKIRLKADEKKDRFKSLVSLIISDVILLLLMAGLIWAWWNGKIEERDNNYPPTFNSIVDETTTEQTNFSESIEINANVLLTDVS